MRVWPSYTYANDSYMTTIISLYVPNCLPRIRQDMLLPVPSRSRSSSLSTGCSNCWLCGRMGPSLIVIAAATLSGWLLIFFFGPLLTCFFRSPHSQDYVLDANQSTLGSMITIFFANECINSFYLKPIVTTSVL